MESSWRSCIKTVGRPIGSGNLPGLEIQDSRLGIGRPNQPSGLGAIHDHWVTLSRSLAKAALLLPLEHVAASTRPIVVNRTQFGL